MAPQSDQHYPNIDISLQRRAIHMDVLDHPMAASGPNRALTGEGSLHDPLSDFESRFSKLASDEPEGPWVHRIPQEPR
jgi:hypothetical protein